MSAIAYLSVGLGSITVGEAAILILLIIVAVKLACLRRSGPAAKRPDAAFDRSAIEPASRRQARRR